MALARGRLRCCAVVADFRSMQPGAEPRSAGCECARFVVGHVRGPLPGAAVRGPLPEREREPGAAPDVGLCTPTRGAGRARVLPGRFPRSGSSLPAPDAERESD